MERHVLSDRRQFVAGNFPHDHPRRAIRTDGVVGLKLHVPGIVGFEFTIFVAGRSNVRQVTGSCGHSYSLSDQTTGTQVHYFEHGTSFLREPFDGE
jgi:hypothetical protein